MKRARCIRCNLLLAFIAAGLALQQQACSRGTVAVDSGNWPEELFLFQYVDNAVFQYADSLVIEERRVLLNLHLFEDETVDSLILNVPDGKAFYAVRETLIVYVQNLEYTWVGRIPNADYPNEHGDSVLFTVFKGETLGLAGGVPQLPGRTQHPYQLRKNRDDPDPIYRLQAIDVSKFPPD